MPTLPDVTDLGPRPVPRSQRQPVSVRNAGATGEAVAGIGQVVAQAGEELYRLDQRRQAAQAGIDFARLTQEATLSVNQSRADAAPGAAGHRQAVEQDLDGRIGTFLTSIRDPEVRQRYEAATAEYRGNVVGREDGWEIEKRRALAVDNIDAAYGLSATQITQNPDAATYEALDRSLIDSIAAGGLDADTAARIQRQRRAGLATAYLQGLAETNPDGARAVLRSGVLNERLAGDPDAITRLTDVVDGEIRVREADQRRLQAAAREQVQQQVQILDRRFQDGDPTLTDADIQRVQDAATAAGILSEVYDAARYRVRLNVQRQYRNATPIELSQAIGTVEARIGQAGQNARPDDQIALNEMRTMLTARTQQVQNNPLGALAQTGIQVAPVDASNPASVRARVTAARTAERQFGFFSFYTPQEVAQLQQVAGSGPNGRLQVVNEVAAIGQYDRDAAERAAMQIAPNDRVFRHAIRLNPARRAFILQGADSLRSMNQNLQVGGNRVSFEAASAAWFQRNIAPQLRLQNSEYVNDVLATARAYYAEVSRQAGVSGRTDFSEQNFASAVNVALGASSGRGGTGYWSYGPRTPEGGSYGLVLPSRMNQADFDRTLTYLPLARLGETWPNGSTNGTARWSSGQNISADDLRSRFIPVMVSDGVYEFHGPNGGAVINERGQAWRLNVYALQGAAADRRRTRTQQPARQIPARTSDRRERTLGGD